MSGISRTVITSHIITDVFKIHLKRYSHALNRKKPVSAFRVKKSGRLFGGGLKHKAGSRTGRSK